MLSLPKLDKGKGHENYGHLIWTLAKTDFTLRYHGSMLGYIWAILKPLLLFAILNFVFSSLFNPRTLGSEHYSLELLIGIVMFTFFSEGSTAGMMSLMSKAQLVTKIYVPRWAIIIAATLNSLLVFCMNFIVVVAFFIFKAYLPSVGAIAMFFVSCVLVYATIVAFSLTAAPLYVRFRDLLMIWEVLLSALFYATPIIYPLKLMPVYVQRTLLVNPMAFIIHFTKESIFNNHFPHLGQMLGFIIAVIALLFISIFLYRRLSKTVAENI